MDDLKELLIISVDRSTVDAVAKHRYIDLPANTLVPFCLYVALHEMDNQGQIRYLSRILREEPVEHDGEEVLRLYLGPVISIPFLLTIPERRGLMEPTTFEKLLTATEGEDLFADGDEEELMYVKLSPEFHQEYDLPELVPIIGMDPESMKSRGSIPIDVLVRGMERIMRLEPNHIHRDRFLAFLSRAYIGMGVSLAMEEHYEQAIWQLRKALKINPENGEARFHLANVYFDAEQVDKALQEYRKSLNQNPDSTRTRTYLGIALASAGQFEEALNHWHTVVSQKQSAGEDVEVFIYINMGKAYLNLDQLDKSEQMFRTAVALEPDNLQAKNHLGITLANQGKLQEAIDLWYDVLGHETGAADSYLYFNLGRALFNQGNYRKSIIFMMLAEHTIDEPEITAAIPMLIESAEAKLQHAAETSVEPGWRKPDFERYYRRKFGVEVIGYTAKIRRKVLPDVLEELLFDLDEATLDSIITIRMALDRSKPSVNFDQETGALEIQGKFTAATCSEIIPLAQRTLAATARAVRSEDGADQRTDDGGTEGPDRELILEKLKQRIIKNPSDEWAHYNLGATLIQFNEMSEALKCFEKAVKLNPNNAMAYHALGLVQARLNREDEAIKAFQKAIITVPDSKLSDAYEQWGYKDSLAYFDLGDVLMKKKMYDEALVSFQKGLDIDASVPLAHYQIGVCHLMKQSFKEAAEAFRNAVLLNAGFAPAYNRLGLSLLRLEAYEQAKDAYTKALDLNPGDAEALFCLGQIALLQDNEDEARTFLGKAAEFSDDNTFALRARELLDKLDQR